MAIPAPVEYSPRPASAVPAVHLTARKSGDDLFFETPVDKNVLLEVFWESKEVGRRENEGLLEFALKALDNDLTIFDFFVGRDTRSRPFLP